MAYQVSKRKVVEEELQLVEDGEVKHTIKVSLHPDDVAVNINRKYIALTKALSTTTEMKRKAESHEEIGDCFEILGRAVCDMFEAVFGAENTNTILEFYENRYIEMTQEVLPFITTVIIPKITEISRENRARIEQKYNRRQRRKLGIL